MQKQLMGNQRNAAIYIASSPWFVFLATTCYASMGIALWLLAWPWLVRLIIVLLLIIDYRLMIKTYGLRNHAQSVTILMQDCDKWLYKLQNGKTYKGCLIKQRTFCSSLVLIMYIRSMNTGRYVLIPRDSLSKHNFRFIALQINNSK